MTRAADHLPDAITRLRAAGVEDPVRDARRLMAFALGVPADRMTLHLGDVASVAALARFDAAVVARCARQPLSQIVGQRLFWGRAFEVTRETLDPRPETEALISEALSAPFDRVLDLGTGTGAILLTLLAESPQAVGVGGELSAKALEVAQRNAAALGLGGRVQLLHSDWFSAVDGRFDLIVSNPPYIAEDEMPLLQPEVRDWEPHLALTPGGDGLAPYRVIARDAGRHLEPGGRILVEIGHSQGEAVSRIFAAEGFAMTEILRDLDGRDRVVKAMRP